MQQQINRRLAAILATDVVGYSRMMEADEAGTHSALQRIWDETFNPAVARSHGRIVKKMGDGMLVEFGSVIAAVECAVAIQRTMHERNQTGRPQVEFRIGINLGDGKSGLQTGQRSDWLLRGRTAKAFGLVAHGAWVDRRSRN
ncbi:adenylate/guanylate cyclase domain-containing protein [Mesorhizobium sp. 131-2-1]|uniref:adenylate/guanylate cyclase domain-containing protein n=1 Tax=Mesorhizobium sp. 131-2-1 TaxID=2744518 RepID=UPI001938295A|nr:adenylate/guanylate cyclase domain-containing protein [Mesorhizobium sp. 131-2-1]BCG94128.1 hypothetical protein MesoLj131a_29920 [Mesorhizobium sp. 131-2-1]